MKIVLWDRGAVSSGQIYRVLESEILLKLGLLVADTAAQLSAMADQMQGLYNSGSLVQLANIFTEDSIILAIGGRKFDGRDGQ